MKQEKDAYLDYLDYLGVKPKKNGDIPAGYVSAYLSRWDDPEYKKWEAASPYTLVGSSYLRMNK